MTILARRRRRSLRVLMVAVILLSLGIVALEARRLASLYWHDVGLDHAYEFEAAERFRVALDEDGFGWPAAETGGKTALLSLELHATPVGRWSEPSVECAASGVEGFVQHLERGAAGRRFLNLSALAVAELPVGERVELTGSHLDWDEQEAELLLFDAPGVDRGPLLVLAPHPDDAEIAAFGLYSDSDSWIVTITAGEGVDARMAHLLPDAAARSRLKGELRVWDSVSVPLWGGVPAGQALNLGYHTLSLAPLYREPDRVVADALLGDEDLGLFRELSGFAALDSNEASSSWSSLVDDLATVIESIGPATIVSPYPELDAAADHKLTTMALFEALLRLGPAGRTLLLYTNHHATSEYFPFGPAHSVVSLPPWTEPPLLARGVFSHPLDSATCLRKLYALEAQHDLRPAPRYVSERPLLHFFGEILRKLQQLWRDPTDTYSYMRRAARPNELFLLLEDSDVPALLEQSAGYLTGLRGGAE